MKKIRPLGITFDDVLLVPQKTSIISRADVDISGYLTPKIKLTVPIVSANMDTVTGSEMALEMARLGGIGIIHRFLTIEDHVAEIRHVKKAGHIVGAAIGINGGHMDRAEALVKAGVDVVVIDIAHGHSTHLIKQLRLLKKKFKKTEFIAGNVATYQGAKDLIAAGADTIKVGIGPGSLCTTRIVAGSGVPQITAIMEAVRAAAKNRVPIIGDGGIRNSGDIVKTLATGASSVMLGSYLAGCEESPALTFFRQGDKFKLTRGMASLTANHERQRNTRKILKDLKRYTAEGVEAIVPYKGAVADIITQLTGGIRSGFSYSGAKDLPTLWKQAEFIQISNNALIESHPHDVKQL